jgi:hypothetical protein
MIRRVRAYMQGHFGLDWMARAELHDPRQAPRIALPFIWLTAALLFVVNFRSLIAFDQSMKRCHGSGRSGRPAGCPSERTLRRVFEGIRLDDLRRMIGLMVQVLRRSKAPLTLARRHGLVAAAVDGHECFASPVRGCPECRERRIHTKDRQTGEKRTHTEYYHKVVFCFLVDALIPVILDVEMVRPGEGELTAARRLLTRVLREHARLFDVVTGDALYGDKEIIQLIRRAGRHFVIVLKDDRREVHDEARRLRRHLKPRMWRLEGRHCTVWDVCDLPSWWRGPKVALRVVWSEERSKQPVKGRTRRGQTEWVTSTWVWLTDLPAAVCTSYDIWRFGHRRWHIENRCFHEGVKQWNFDHCFHHHPNAICAFLLTAGISMMVVHTFLKRNVKEALRALYSILSLRDELFKEFGEDLSWSGWVRASFLDGS